MSNQIHSAIPHATPDNLDSSLCHEALGFLTQSYDLIDGLLREVARVDHGQPVAHTETVQLTLIGQPDGLASVGHLFL